MSRLPDLATELVHSGVDVIVTSTNPTTLAAKKATTTIPIIMTVGVDPVAAGLVASLARPGGRLTGVQGRSGDLSAKRLELLKEMMPRLRRVGADQEEAPGARTRRRWRCAR